MSGNLFLFVFTLYLGLLFITNQITELTLPLHLFALGVFSGSLFLVNIHALHITIGSILFLVVLILSFVTMAADMFINFTILY